MKSQTPTPMEASPAADAARVEQSMQARDAQEKGADIEPLPNEILYSILDFIPPGRQSQSTLWAFCLVRRQWRCTGEKYLYRQPYLYGRNYDLFVRTICPSVNLHVKKSELAGLVQILDLRNIVHQSSKSMTARLLGRTKTSLRAFVAPQASFAVNCLAALSKCSELHTLDLSLISEAISISALTNALQRLPRLKVLYFPRSSNDSRKISGSITWPPLEELHLSGPLERAFVDQLAGDAPGQGSLPSNLTNLSIEHCTRLPLLSIQKLMIGIGTQLERLKVSNIPGLVQHDIDFVLKHCPNLKCLEVSLDYITSRFGELDRWDLSSHPLERLDLLRVSDDQFSGFGLQPRELLPEHLIEALDKGYFPKLRIIRVSKAAHWHTDKLEEVEELQGELELNYMTNNGTESMDKRIEVDSLYNICKDQGFLVFMGHYQLLSRLDQFVQYQNDLSPHFENRYGDFELYHFEAGDYLPFSRYHCVNVSEWTTDGLSIFAKPFSGMIVNAWVCSLCVWKSMVISAKEMGIDLPAYRRPCRYAPSVWDFSTAQTLLAQQTGHDSNQMDYSSEEEDDDSDMDYDSEDTYDSDQTDSEPEQENHNTGQSSHQTPFHATTGTYFDLDSEPVEF